MTVPFFYIAAYDGTQTHIVLDEDTSRHVVQVLRMRKGDSLNLTDGKGNLLSCKINDDNKKHCAVGVSAATYQPKNAREVSIAISLLKNANRFEWFLEKATEIGIDRIIPIICERTEKEKFRYDRMMGICTSAMLQSQQVWMPLLDEPVDFTKWISGETRASQKFIAHCIPGEKNELAGQVLTSSEIIICIGPEGDFSQREVEQAVAQNFIPVGLGPTRLRTETAGVVAATLLRQAIE